MGPKEACGSPWRTCETDGIYRSGGMWDLPRGSPKALKGRVHIMLHAIGLPARKLRDPRLRAYTKVVVNSCIPGPVNHLTSLQGTRELEPTRHQATRLQPTRLEDIKLPDQGFKTGGNLKASSWPCPPVWSSGGPACRSSPVLFWCLSLSGWSASPSRLLFLHPPLPWLSAGLITRYMCIP